jgi:hypothetical protein
MALQVLKNLGHLHEVDKKKFNKVDLGSIVVVVLTIESKVRWFKPGRGRCILRAIKIRRTISFGGK